MRTILLTLLRLVFSFTNVNINTAAFDGLNNIPEYRDLGTRYWKSKMANNIGRAYRLSAGQLAIDNDLYAAGVSITYDLDRIYTGKYVNIRFEFAEASVVLPRRSIDDGDWTYETTIQLTAVNQNLESSTTTTFFISAPASGGIVIISDTNVALYFTAVITELNDDI